MFRVLIADDDYEDRELLKMEIQKALKSKDPNLVFFEASSVREAVAILKSHFCDLMTLDIEFDRMNEGIEVLPDIFENFPTLNIVVISGKLNKAEVTDQLFRFTKDNVLKGKRWVRHFDVLDKKDDKTAALQQAYSFALKQQDVSDNIRDLFLLAESHMEKGEVEKCLDVYQKIQNLSPGESESGENLRIFRGGVSADQALDYFKKGEKIVGSLILGHYLEVRLKIYTRKIIGHFYPGLYECLKELEQTNKISQFKKSLFQQILRFRNKAIHHPSAMTESDFDMAIKNLKILEARF